MKRVFAEREDNIQKIKNSPRGVLCISFPAYYQLLLKRVFAEREDNIQKIKNSPKGEFYAVEGT
ncbi:MAG: hypothetical protein IJ583_08270 [Firmicutes bacterium]|nr:hypothetical protein [Bacillota bacterium]